MTRFIGVLGPGRCGSSAVAGALHAAGIPVGRDLIGPHPQWNVKGHFEDRTWHRFNRLVAYHLCDPDDELANETVERYPEFAREPWTRAELLQRYEAELHPPPAPVWAMKCIMLGVIWPVVQHLFPQDRRLIVVQRNRDTIIHSRMEHSRLSFCEAATLTDRLMRRARKSALGAGCPVLWVQYEELIADPETQVRRILAFAAEGMDAIRLDERAAMRHIDPEMDHHGYYSPEHV